MLTLCLLIFYILYYPIKFSYTHNYKRFHIFYLYLFIIFILNFCIFMFLKYIYIHFKIHLCNDLLQLLLKYRFLYEIKFLWIRKRLDIFALFFKYQICYIFWIFYVFLRLCVLCIFYVYFLMFKFCINV